MKNVRRAQELLSADPAGWMETLGARISESEPELDTPNVSIHPAHHDGVFRVEVRPDGDTIVIVRAGQA